MPRANAAAASIPATSTSKDSTKDEADEEELAIYAGGISSNALGMTVQVPSAVYLGELMMKRDEQAMNKAVTR